MNNQNQNNENNRVCDPCEQTVVCRKKTSIGGQALMEGIMMRGPKMSAMAVRNPQGEIVIERWATMSKPLPAIARLPIIRGVVNFISSMSTGYRCLMRSAEISGLEELEAEMEREKQEKKARKAEKKAAKSEKTTDTVQSTHAEQAEPQDAPTQSDADAAVAKDSTPESSKSGENKGSSAMMNAMMAVAMVLGVGLALLLFVWLPGKIYMWLPDSIFSPDNRYLRSVFEGVLKIALLVGYMASVSLMKDIRRTFMFHGAEHKTIFCYEAGLDLTVENVRKMRRFHPRCGTSFLIIMLLVSIFVGFFIPPSLNMVLRTAIKLLLIPIIMGIGYELIKFAGRHDNIVTRIVSAPGLWLQRITVLEPDDDMIECAITAVKEVIPEDGSDRI
ncbi:MAG: DUF1385 domain-containing protein [Clostridia bacterium]|nr:DUF1385 domain-containing protein [Clostridia bacterium]